MISKELEKIDQWVHIHDVLFGWGYWNPVKDQRVFAYDVKRFLGLELHKEVPVVYKEISHKIFSKGWIAADSAKVELFLKLLIPLKIQASKERDEKQLSFGNGNINLPKINVSFPKLVS